MTVIEVSAIGFRTAGDLAYDALRDAVISGGLEPGTHLNQDELAKRLGVSRAPVRDALMRLESEGLVQTSARKGVVVSTMTPKELVDIFELRAILDSQSARLACRRLTPDDLDRLQRNLEATERLTPDGRLEDLVRHHAEFHYGIYSACDNAELERVARNLWDRSYRFRVKGLQDRELALRSLAAHRAILAALCDRDEERVAQLISDENHLIISTLLPDLREREGRETVQASGERVAPGSGESDA